MLLAHLAQVALPSAPGAGPGVGMTAAIAAGVIGSVKFIDYLADRRRDRKAEERAETTLDQAVATIGQKLDESQRRNDERFETIERQVLTLSAHLVGPDGENGIRGDLREVKKRVIGLEERERDRLASAIGAKDRRIGL